MQLFPIIFSNYFFAWATVHRGMKTTKHLCEIWMQVCQIFFFFNIYPILPWINKYQWNYVGCSWLRGFHILISMGLNINLKEEGITFFGFWCCFWFLFVCLCPCMKSCPVAQSTGAWDNFLGKYQFMIHHPGCTRDTRCGSVWVLQTAQSKPSVDRMVGWEDPRSDTLLLSLCSGIYFSSTFSKQKNWKPASHPNSFAIVPFWSVSLLNTKKHFQIFSLSYLTLGNLIFINSRLHVRILKTRKPVTNLPRLLVKIFLTFPTTAKILWGPGSLHFCWVCWQLEELSKK